jgi:carboxymethylenebutenolidase
MCDDDVMDEMLQYQLRQGLSRRQLGAFALGAGALSVLPAVADAPQVSESEVEIKTPDGTCDAYFVHPAKGAHPGVLIWPDIFGLRPAFRQMGKRLSQSGYSVLVVNPFYRQKKAPTAPEHPDFNDPATRSALMALMGSLSQESEFTDAKAFVGWLDGKSPVDRRKKMGTMGYCMAAPSPCGRPRRGRIGLAPAPPSTAAVSSPTSPTALICSSRR